MRGIRKVLASHISLPHDVDVMLDWLIENTDVEKFTGFNVVKAIRNRSTKYSLIFESLHQYWEHAADDIGKKIIEKGLINIPRDTGITLSNINLSGMDLSGIDLNGCILDNMNLRRCKLLHSDLRNIRVTRSTMNMADISGSNMNNAHYFNVRMPRLMAKNTKMDNIYIGASLAGYCDITGSTMSGCIEDTDMKRSIFDGSHIHRMTFLEVDLFAVSMSMTRIDTSVFIRCNLTRAKMSDANIFDVNFSTSDMYNAKLPSAS